MATVFPTTTSPRDIGSIVPVVWDLTQRGYAEVLVGRGCSWSLDGEDAVTLTFEIDRGSGYGSPVPVDVDDTITSASALIAKINSELGDDLASHSADGAVAIRAEAGVRITGSTQAVLNALGIPTIERRADDAASETIQVQNISSTEAIETVSIPINVPDEARRVSLFGTVGPGIDGPDNGGVVLFVVWGNGTDNEGVGSLLDIMGLHVPTGLASSDGPDGPVMQPYRASAASILTTRHQLVIDVPPWGKHLRLIPLSTASKTRRPGIFSARVGFSR